MKWFKHDVDASTDAKVKKLIIKYGAEGYAVYFHCLELIAGNISETNITFELEHDAEIIADNLKIKGTPERSSIDIVNDIMNYIVFLDLFSQSDGRIFCFKMLKRLDSSMTSSQKFRGLITKAKASHDLVMTNHDAVMQEQNRTEQIRREETITEKNKKEGVKRFTPPSPEQVQEYIQERGIKSFTGSLFCDSYEMKGWMVGKNKMKDWRAAVRTWEQRDKKPDDKSDAEKIKEMYG